MSTMVRVCTLTALVALFLTGCATSRASVPVRGEVTETALLAGEWRGQFDGAREERHGKIEFNLEMGRHTADGEVVVFAPKKGEPPMQLRIEYLAVEDNKITGKIEPYTDPECDCVVETEFEGDLTGDFIIGTYAARMPATGAARKGEWSAERIDR